MRKFACITLDMEPDYGDPERRIRLLQDPLLLDRFVQLVNRNQGKVTMFTVTSLFSDFGDAFQNLAERIPLELEVHSHTHNPDNGSGRDEVEAAHAAYRQFTGRVPRGYRAPIGRISREGLGHLMDCGYLYDSSVYTSVRPGKFGYFNLHIPNGPFWFTRGGQDCLLEFPFTSISTARVVFALSYAKLLGWGLYSTLLGLFGLPDVALLLVHPYNFYTRSVAGGLHGAEKFALTRNDEKSFDYFEKMIAALTKRGYRFAFASEIYAEMLTRPDLRRLPWEEWR